MCSSVFVRLCECECVCVCICECVFVPITPGNPEYRLTNPLKSFKHSSTRFNVSDKTSTWTKLSLKVKTAAASSSSSSSSTNVVLLLSSHKPSTGKSVYMHESLNMNRTNIHLSARSSSSEIWNIPNTADFIWAAGLLTRWESGCTTFDPSLTARFEFCVFLFCLKQKLFIYQ